MNGYIHIRMGSPLITMYYHAVSSSLKSSSVFRPKHPKGEQLSLSAFVHLVRRREHRRTLRQHRSLWALDYHFQNAGEFSMDGKTWQTRARHTAHLYAPNTRYWERCSADDIPFPETYIVFSAKGVEGLEALVADGGGLARFMDESRILADCFEELFETAQGRGGSLRAQGALYAIMDCLLRGVPTDTANYSLRSLPPGLASLSERVDAYIHEHYQSRLTLDTIARAMGVSRSTLTHQYRSETGTSPIAQLCEWRLETARTMIVRGEPLKIVAEQTGFYDEYYLSKAFRRRFGLPPRRYARGDITE